MVLSSYRQVSPRSTADAGGLEVVGLDPPLLPKALAIRDWLLTEAAQLADSGQILPGLAERLIALGIPIDRITYYPSAFQAAQRGGGAMRRCRQRRRRRKPRVNSDIRLRATFRRCAPAVFFRQASGSRPHPTCRSTPPSGGPATAPARAGPADRCA